MPRTLKINPDEARKMTMDVKELLKGSTSAIDSVYEQHNMRKKDLHQAKSLMKDLKGKGRSSPELPKYIKETEKEIRDLDRRIIDYASSATKDIESHLKNIKKSSGASRHASKIKNIEKQITQIRKKAKKGGVDIRNDVGKARESVLLLEQGLAKKNPCIGMHVHSEDMPMVLEALGAPTKNPSKRKKATKKKTAKKKTTKRRTSEPDRLIRKCQKLWDHYCERPSKKRLKPVFDHLEKMKESKSERVKEERSRCLRVAKGEL